MTRLSIRTFALLAAAGSFLLGCRLAAAGDFELTAAQRARLQKFLPNTFGKLNKKEPVHVIIVGDSVMDMTVHTDDESDTLKSYPGVFLEQLADQFYYTGGLRVVRPKKGKPEKSLAAYGPEITVSNLSRGGRTMIHAMNILAASAWNDKPDLVMVSFGINDANSGLSLSTYRRAVQDVIDAAKKNHADLILAGSTPTMTDPPEMGLALTRPYVGTMRDVAEANGVFFADLGDISWLVRVDEPMKDLEKPVPKKKKDEGESDKKKPTAAAPTEDLIKIPMPEELDPDPEKRAARLFRQVATSLRRWFDHGSTMDLIHPNTAMHRLLGRRLFTELCDGPREAPWSVGLCTAKLVDSDHCEVTYRMENTGDAALRLNLLPLVTRHWRPKDAETQLEIPAGRKRGGTITYVRNGSALDWLPSHETFLRLPVMILGNGMARIEELHSRIDGLTMQWNLGSQFNQEGGVTLTGKIVNTSAAPINGQWQAEWLGQKFSSDFKAPAGGESPVKLQIKLPVPQTPLTRQSGTLAFNVTAENLTLRFPRMLEIIENIGLRQPCALFAQGQYQTDKPAPPPAPGPAQPGVTLKVDADPKALYLTWDILGMNLVENSGGVAVGAEVSLDARSYGKRLGHGVIEPIRVSAGAADSAGAVAPLRPWCFGNGYAVDYDRNIAQAMLSSRPDGSRRLTLMLPRSVFHLHEWALGNGNSQLGINSRIEIWQPPDGKNPEGSDHDFSLFEDGMPRDDAEALAVLELTAQPTRRWTAHFY
jgi:lysophospholipase L1-like esterase